MMAACCTTLTTLILVVLGGIIGFIIAIHLPDGHWHDWPGWSQADSAERTTLVGLPCAGAVIALVVAISVEARRRHNAARLHRRQQPRSPPAVIGTKPEDPVFAIIITNGVEALPQINIPNAPDLEAQVVSKNSNALGRPEDSTPLPSYTTSCLGTPQAPPPMYTPFRRSDSPI